MEQTKTEYACLLAGADFELVGVTPSATPVCVMEAKPVHRSRPPLPANVRGIEAHDKGA